MSVARGCLAHVTYSSAIGIVFTKMTINGDLASTSCQKWTLLLRKCLEPYGFIGKYQGIQAQGKSIGHVVEEIFSVKSEG